MRNVRPRAWGAILLSVCLVVGCGARRGSSASDFEALLREGRCTEAAAAAEASGTVEPPTRLGIFALCRVAKNPNPTAATTRAAVTLLRKDGGEMHHAAAALAMLDAALLLPSPLSPDISRRLTEAALGAVGFGPAAPAESVSTAAPGAATRTLAVSVLERISQMLESVMPEKSSMLTYWNGCYSLLGGTFEAADDREAWRLYRSTAQIGVALSLEAPTSDLTQAVLGGVISVVETNSGIQVAVRCDLASPFDDLKRAVAYNRTLSARLEAAVKDASGCTRGTFAP